MVNESKLLQIQAVQTVYKGLKKRLKRLKPYNLIKKRRLKLQIEAMEEGQRDILTPEVTGNTTASNVIDKNNYKTYAKQVNASYEYYSNRGNYGGELYRGLISSRVALIGGEGLSVAAHDGAGSATQKYIDHWMKTNKLNGSKLLRLIRIGELEGRQLTLLKKVRTGESDGFIRLIPYAWYVNNYEVQYKGRDLEEILAIMTVRKSDSKPIKISNPQNAIYTRLGGTDDRPNETSNRLHVVLTQIENFSRAEFDLNNLSFLFGKYMPYWKTETRQEAEAINNEIASGNWQIGRGYAGSADFSMVGPPNDSGMKVIIETMLSALRIITATVGLPIHWLSHPDLMSNRATAENLLEVVNGATKEDRLLWEESFTEMLEKSRIAAIDAGYEDNDIMGEFTVKLPMVSLAMLKQIIEVWAPLVGEFVSKAHVQNLLPGINPNEENKKMKKEAEEAAENSFNNNETLDKTLDRLDEEGEGNNE